MQTTPSRRIPGALPILLLFLLLLTLPAATASAYMHPTLGRWLQRDPAGYVDGMGLYEYCRSAPTMYSDRMGLASICGGASFIRTSGSVNAADAEVAGQPYRQIAQYRAEVIKELSAKPQDVSIDRMESKEIKTGGFFQDLREPVYTYAAHLFFIEFDILAKSKEDVLRMRMSFSEEAQSFQYVDVKGKQGRIWLPMAKVDKDIFYGWGGGMVPVKKAVMMRSIEVAELLPVAAKKYYGYEGNAKWFRVIVGDMPAMPKRTKGQKLVQGPNGVPAVLTYPPMRSKAVVRQEVAISEASAEWDWVVENEFTIGWDKAGKMIDTLTETGK